MAIFNLEISYIQRSNGGNSVGKAGYIIGQDLTNEATGEAFRTANRDDILAVQSFAPHGLTIDAKEFWAKNENAHKHPRSVTAMDGHLTLPHELPEAEQIALAERFSAFIAEHYGVAVTMAVHRGGEKGGDDRNTHAHFLVSMKELKPDGSLGKKQVLLDGAHCKIERAKELKRAHDAKEEPRPTPPTPAELLREKWETFANEALERHGLDQRIDRRKISIRREEAIAQEDWEQVAKLDDQRLFKLGSSLTHQERTGRETDPNGNAILTTYRNRAERRILREALIQKTFELKVAELQAEAEVKGYPAIEIDQAVRQNLLKQAVLEHDTDARAIYERQQQNRLGHAPTPDQLNAEEIRKAERRERYQQGRANAQAKREQANADGLEVPQRQRQYRSAERAQKAGVPFPLRPPTIAPTKKGGDMYEDITEARAKLRNQSLTPDQNRQHRLDGLAERMDQRSRLNQAPSLGSTKQARESREAQERVSNIEQRPVQMGLKSQTPEAKFAGRVFSAFVQMHGLNLYSAPEVLNPFQRTAGSRPKTTGMRSARIAKLGLTSSNIRFDGSKKSEIDKIIDRILQNAVDGLEKSLQRWLEMMDRYSHSVQANERPRMPRLHQLLVEEFEAKGIRDRKTLRQAVPGGTGQVLEKVQKEFVQNPGLAQEAVVLLKRLQLDTQAFDPSQNRIEIDGVNSGTKADIDAKQLEQLRLYANDPDPRKRDEFRKLFEREHDALASLVLAVDQPRFLQQEVARTQKEWTHVQQANELWSMKNPKPGLFSSSETKKKHEQEQRERLESEKRKKERKEQAEKEIEAFHRNLPEYHRTVDTLKQELAEARLQRAQQFPLFGEPEWRQRHQLAQRSQFDFDSKPGVNLGEKYNGPTEPPAPPRVEAPAVPPRSKGPGYGR